MNALPPLIDAHGRTHDYLRVSLTDRCNFRCLYCMPDEGVEWKPKDEIMSLEEIEQIIRLFVRLGVKKVRLTGGEPSVRKRYIDLIARLTPHVPVYLTTNGSTLVEHAQHLAEAGLSGVNISLDSLSAERFHKITRRDELDRVLGGIEQAVSAGLNPKINVVVMRGMNEDEVAGFVRHFADQPVQVRFIEFMPFLGNQWRPDIVVPYAEMRDLLGEFDLQPLPGQATDVAKDFTIPGHQATVGFVTSVTESFCGGCNRLRVTAEGQFKTCLFLPPRTSLRDAMRSGMPEEELVGLIRADLNTKWAAHPPMRTWQQRDILSMVQIGG